MLLHRSQLRKENHEAMRSQVRFIMHPDDEADFVRIITAEPGIVFVNGPNWSTPGPPIMTDFAKPDSYLMIWNPTETPKLIGTHFRNGDEEWWNCKNEFLTLQFLRSGFQHGEPFLLEGSVSVGTTDQDKSFFHKPSAPAVDERFKTLRKFIRKTYTTKVIIWQPLDSPRSKTKRNIPDTSLWVGLHAMKWLRQKRRKRWVQQCRYTLTGGYLVD